MNDDQEVFQDAEYEFKFMLSDYAIDESVIHVIANPEKAKEILEAISKLSEALTLTGKSSSI